MPAHEEEAAKLLADEPSSEGRGSTGSLSSTSTTSLVLERIDGMAHLQNEQNKRRHNQDSQHPYTDDTLTPEEEDVEKEYDLEGGTFNTLDEAASKRFCRGVWIVAAFFVGLWLLAALLYLGRQEARSREHDPSAEVTIGFGKKVTLDEVQHGEWRPQKQTLSWISGANGEDGLLLERAQAGKDYLIVEDIRRKNSSGVDTLDSTTLMKYGTFNVDGMNLIPGKVWPSPDLKKVLIATDVVSNWRHSYFAKYWIFDVATQGAEPLDPTDIHSRVQLASWSPQSDAIVFTREHNMYLRKLSTPTVVPITKDGGDELFYGVPDWVYEEEVFQANSATWWAEDGKYVAMLKTDESAVPEYPVQFFLSRPSGKKPLPGLESYPEVEQIKYPKAGAPNPTVSLLFYDVVKGETFEVKTTDEFPDNDRLITEVVWAGSTGKAIVRETNRDSDILRVVITDVISRSARTVRTENISELDGGWFEVSQDTRYIPADPTNGRPQDGYIDTVIYENYDHLAYFTPIDNPKPFLLTSGEWEVVNAPSAVDLKNNLVYFVSTKESPIQRHSYSVKLDGTDMQPVTDTSKEGYYGSSFSNGAGYALLDYNGPGIPWQKVISTRSNEDHYEHMMEENKDIAEMAKKHELPILIYSTVNIDGFDLQVVERRPPHFDERKQYPVLFFLYGGPASQTVSKEFRVDFQSYIASNLGYIVVTVDGRGTGFIGRKARSIIRGNIGYWEAHDQIETAKIWAAKKYVDASRLAIWGWSYGGFLTLKTLEQDAGQTFSYGMAVAPVTDWRFYDSIYTERYMHTPQENPSGYENSSISNMSALHENVRFLVMHGISDDNVHMQSTLTLLDKLDLAEVENYDVHVFPDSDHSIFFHNANRIVYDKLSNWLVNAFNGEWLRTAEAVPLDLDSAMDG